MTDDEKRQALANIDQYMLTDEEWAKEKEAALRLAHDFAIGSDNMMPHLLVQTRKYDLNKPGVVSEKELMMICIAVEMWDREGKRKLLEGLGCKVYSEQRIPLSVIFMAEAFVRTRTGPDDKVLPFDDPNAKEVIYLCGANLRSVRSGAMWTASLPVTRDAQNNFIKAGEIMQSEDGQAVLINDFLRGYSMGTNRSRRRPDNFLPS